MNAVLLFTYSSPSSISYIEAAEGGMVRWGINSLPLMETYPGSDPEGRSVSVTLDYQSFCAWITQSGGL